MPHSYRVLARVSGVAALAFIVSAIAAIPGRNTNADTAAKPDGQYQYPFQNPDLPVEKRLDNLLSLMTLDEKKACLSSFEQAPRLGIRGTGHLEGLHGLALGGPGKWGRPRVVTTTIFPQSYGMGETWDPEAIHQVGSIEGFEARYIYQNSKYHMGSLIIRAPNSDLGRDPRWGRTEECYGEDPYFNGTMVTAMVEGLQGDDPRYWQTAALLKHFLANSNENGREGSSSNFDERLLREYYSVPFRMGIAGAHARAYMASYNAMNGIPMTANPILKQITVDQWGEDGIICTDAGAMRNMVVFHKYYPDEAHAVAGAVKAGITQFLDRYMNGLNDALKRRLLTQADIDAAVRSNFRVLIHLGLLDPPDRVPYSAIGSGNGGDEPWLSDKNKAAVRSVTQKSIVLLKNENQFLPLDKTKLKSIAVIGPRADQVLQDWYSGTPAYTVSPLEGIKNKVGPDVKVVYSSGESAADAARVARDADVAIVCVGNDPVCEGARWAVCNIPSEGREAVDRKSITLEQEDLVKKVYQANPKTAVVLVCNFPYAINWTEQNVPAIVHLTHCSEEQGDALADVLFGDYNPGGRLVQTWPASLDQLPPMMDYNIRDGRTYMYFKAKPLFPFGYGLSYTTFSYSNLRLSSASLRAGGSISLKVDVKNTGDRAGDDVVEMYVKHIGSAVQRPLEELKGFKRVTLKPGETRAVTLGLKGSDLAYWNVNKKRFIVERDRVRVMIGASASDIKLSRTVSVLE